jgi:hypothetical protein
LDYTEAGDQDTTGRGTALPCLNSNISIEHPPADTPAGASEGTTGPAGRIKLSTQHRKTAFILKESVQTLAARYGIESLGFLTLTFREHITDAREAQRRLNSLISNVIKSRYGDYVGVMERQKSGRIHYHLLVALGVDIRTGFDFAGIERRDYSSANTELRAEWAFWRRTAPRYGFGRTELLPIKSTIEAMAKYVGKYIAKHTENRDPADKGVRLVRYSKGARAGTTRFQFQSEGSMEWRRKVATFAQIVQEQHPDTKVSTLSDLSRVLGKRWAYHHRDYILSLP